MNIPFIGGAYTERSPDLNAQTCVNLYPVAGGPDGQINALYGTPGLAPYATIGTTAIRGMHVFGNELFAVSGSTLYRITLARPVGEPIGNLTTNTGPVRFADNGRVLVLVDGARADPISGTAQGGYLWDGNTLSPITAAGFPGVSADATPQHAPSHITFVGGYFVLDDPNTPGRFMVSGLYATDPATLVDALSFATAESDPDGLVAIAGFAGKLWLMGRRNTEVWYPSNAELPFDPIAGGGHDRGCLAPQSVARADANLLWLASDPQGRVQVVMSQGSGSIKTVSTPAIETALAKSSAAELAAATGYGYHQEGHTFYLLNLPNATWAYDLTTGFWHRRGSWQGTHYNRHIGDTYIYYNHRHLLGDYRSGRLYALDLDCYTDNGSVIRRERTGPALHGNGKPLFFHALSIGFETGVGGHNIPPRVMLDWSDDGGHSWSDTRLGNLGQTGEYGRPVTWRRLGHAQKRMLRTVISDPVKVAILNATLDYEVGP